jgi:hypothetical protein
LGASPFCCVRGAKEKDVDFDFGAICLPRQSPAKRQFLRVWAYNEIDVQGREVEKFGAWFRAELRLS